MSPTNETSGVSLMKSRLVIKVTCGVESPEKLAQAFTVAATAISAGFDLSFWLTGESSWLALPGKAEDFHLEHSASISELRDLILASGTLTLCTQCAARRSINQEMVIGGVRIAGAATFVEEIMNQDTQVLVY